LKKNKVIYIRPEANRSNYEQAKIFILKAEPVAVALAWDDL
jgi:hypothetical protein